MSTSAQKTQFEKLADALDSGEFQQIRFILNHSLRPAEVARLIEKSPPKERQILWNLINTDPEGERTGRNSEPHGRNGSTGDHRVAGYR